jgi:hypothetical protein
MAFTAVANYVVGLSGFATVGAAITAGAYGVAALGAAAAIGAAYVTSRIINGNPNKGNNSANNQGGRIQVPPATNNKIPVVYGSAYVNGIITDARLKSLGGTTNDTMYYCIVLSEYTNNLTTPSYALESVLWNDLRLTPVDATTNAHKVKDGRKVVDGAVVTAGSFVVGTTYVITKVGTTNFTAIGAQTNNIGEIFTATGAGSGTGQAQVEDFIDTNFVVDSNSLVELRVYAGGSSAAEQIYPPQSTGNTTPAYTMWSNNDGTWDNTYKMDGLVFAIIKLTYNGDKGFTSLPNVTFQLANNVANPADVWYDYMTSKRYGAGIDPAYIDSTARTAWYNFCEEDISYTSANLNPAGGTGTANQSTFRYNINGVIDTSNQVKTNIDTILQNGGAWMSYNVSTGLWSPIIKKAVSAGQANDVTKQFTASRTGSTLTVATFPSGRIEPGQLLYNSTGTLIGTISAQLTPTAGETTGQIGRYTTSTSGSISSTTFYTLPATSLEFSDDNIISGITISSTRLEDLYNEVEAEFYNRYNKDQRAYARTDLPTIQRNPNEPDNQLRLSLDLVNNSMQADILGQLEMRQSRDDLVIEFTANHYGIQTQAGDIIAVTSELYDWSPKYFRVMRVKEIEGDDGGLVANMQALEYNPDVYTIEPITEFSTAANIKIGNLISSPGLPAPITPVISNTNPNDSVPNFTFNVDIPATGGPFDEAEIYFVEGWDPNSVTGWIDNNSTPGTYSGIAGTIMTITAVTYNSINVGDYFDLGGVTVVNQLTQTTISTKTFASGGAVGAKTFTLNNVTGVVIGQKPTGTGIPTGAMVVGVSGTTVTLDSAFTVQATGSYLFTTAGGTGTYTVNISTAVTGTDDLYDQPIETNFAYLKKIVPTGNASSFTSSSTITTIITELPANSQTFRRYFLKARLGVKKNFGAFSLNTPVDLDGNNVNWQPNPVGGGGTTPLNGVFTSVDINNTTPWLTFSTQPDGVNPQYGIRGKSTVDDAWFVGGASAGDDLGYLELATADNSGGTNSGGEIYARQYSGEYNGGAPWFGGGGTVQRTFTLLDDIGNTYIPQNLTVGSSSQSAPTLNLVNSERSLIITNNASDDLLSFFFNGQNRLQFDLTNQYFNSGRLGVNTATPAYTLDVNGDARVKDGLYISGATSGAVSFTAPAVAGTQDYTLPTAYPIANNYALVSSTSGTLSWRITGDVNGPSSATDNAIVRFDGTTGKLIQNSNVIISDAGDVDGVNSLDVDLAISLGTNLIFEPVGGLGSQPKIQTDYGTGLLDQIILQNNSVSMVQDLILRTNELKGYYGSGSDTAIRIDHANVTVIGDLAVYGGDIQMVRGGSAYETKIIVNGTDSRGYSTDVVIKDGLTLENGNIYESTNINPVIAFSSPGTNLTDITLSNDIIVPGDAVVTGDVSAATLTLNALSTRQVTQTTKVSTSQFTLASTTRTAMKVLVNMVNNVTGATHICEILVVRSGVTADALITVYAEMFSSAVIANFAADYFSGSIRLLATPVSTNSTTFTIIRDSLS